jgi:hypothetical protein
MKRYLMLQVSTSFVPLQDVMDIKDAFLCMDEMYLIIIYTNVTWCKYYSYMKFYVVYFNVSSTKNNVHAKLSRYVMGVTIPKF